ncbi:hypothetical protein [Fredinandcohnia sp. FSL W7-1320]|uniref:hypothetical protein n=1 Tax=Fredinandcohnia sp. FSL W7-1320 TaxID=2954540 RepID=UPI0030FD9835
MNLNNLMFFINDDFPDYKIINIEEIGLPIFKKDITCLATINKSLSDVLEFTLKLFDLGYSVETISKILALDKEIIRHAYYDLDSMDMLDMTTNKVTEEGRKYLEKNSYDTLKKVILPVNIDGYLGEVTTDKNFISNKIAKSINLKTIKPILELSNNTLIEPFKIKKILKDYVKKADSDIDAELVGIMSVKNKSTQFMKLNIVVLESPTKEIRYTIYNRNIKLAKLEQRIDIADEAGIRIFQTVPKDFLEKVNESTEIPAKSKKLEGNYMDILNFEYFEKDNLSLDFVIPLIDVYSIEKDWLIALERYLDRKLKVSIKFVGERYPNEYTKNRVLDLLKLRERYKEYLILNHSINVNYASLTINQKEVFIDKISSYDLNLKTNKQTIQHETLCYFAGDKSKDNVSEIIHSKYLNRSEIKSDIEKLIRLSKELDVQMEECYGLNWLISGQILNQAKLYDIPLATNDSKYSEFTKSLCSSFVEVIQKVGENQGINNYLFNDFKQTFPKLFKALNRLRVYRNSMQHNDLDSKNLKTYLEFICEDLNGQFPEFINGGYLHLQKLIISEMIRAVEETSNDLAVLYS